VIQKIILGLGGLFILFLAGNVVGETSAIINLKSGVLVLGGTLMCALLAFPTRTINDVIKSLKELFQQKGADQELLIKQIETLARVRRKHGAKMLEEEGNKAKNPFVRKGIELVVDGYDRYEIRNIMEKECELYFSFKESQVNVLNTLAKIAPVLGFVGTIIGLIGVLGNLGQTEEIGKGMALALLTTFYGLLFSTFLFLPLARKFSEHVKSEATLLSLVLEGIMDIADQKNSQAIVYRLKSYAGVHEQSRADAPKSTSKKARSALRFPVARVEAGK
jgi:chemotaxis protein MotA